MRNLKTLYLQTNLGRNFIQQSKGVRSNPNGLKNGTNQRYQP